MNIREVEVVSRLDGQRVKVQLLTYPQCDGPEWLIYEKLGPGLTHFQCVKCGQTFYRHHGNYAIQGGDQ